MTNTRVAAALPTSLWCAKRKAKRAIPLAFASLGLSAARSLVSVLLEAAALARAWGPGVFRQAPGVKGFAAAWSVATEHKSFVRQLFAHEARVIVHVTIRCEGCVLLLFEPAKVPAVVNTGGLAAKQTSGRRPKLRWLPTYTLRVALITHALIRFVSSCRYRRAITEGGCETLRGGRG